MNETESPVKFVLTLVPVRGTDPIRALRLILKKMLRQYGMRCVSAHEERETQ